MRLSTSLLVAASMFLAASVGWAMQSGPSQMPSGAGQMGQMRSPEERAALAYNSGVEDMKKADEYEVAAAKETDTKAQEKAHRKAHYAYLSARNEFQDATRLAPKLPEAWNNLGYTQRRLGSYDAALAAYERALTLRPGFPEALEYRGEAYLGLNRIADAKQVYLDLFASNRALSDQFMTAIKRYIDDHRKSGAPDGATLDEFATWVQERSQIAAQTAALTREGTAASWQ